jgi:hypothetical protein
MRGTLDNLQFDVVTQPAQAVSSRRCLSKRLGPFVLVRLEPGRG